MLYKIIYYVLIILLFVISFVFFSKVLLSIYRQGKHGRYTGTSNNFNDTAEDRRKINILDGTGFSFPLYIYQIIRYVFFGVCLVLIFYLKFTVSFSSYNLHLILCFVLLFATSTRERIGRLKLPFYYFYNYMKKINRHKYNREIYRTISQLINLFNMKGDLILGSNYIFDQVIKFADITKPIYLNMMSLWNMNKHEDAVEYFNRSMGTKDAKDLSNVFLKFDHIKTGELKLQLQHYHNNMRLEKITTRERINERNGSIIFGLSITAALIVLLNFVVIVLVLEVFSTFGSIAI